MIEKITTENAPAAIGPYSQAIVYNGLVYTSGQIPINPVTGTVDTADIEGQTKRVLENVKAVLAAAGSSPQKAIKTTCYLLDMADFAAFNAIYETVFTEKPARSCVAAKALPKGVLVEIDVIAAI